MNAKLKALYGRRSVRAFTPRAVPDKMVRDLLEAAMAAPSAMQKDPWRFIVIRGRDVREKIAEGLPYGKMLPKAAVGIVVCGDIESAHDRQLSYLLQDCSAAIENLLLAAHLLGLGAVWLGVHPREPRIEHIRKICGIPEMILPLAVIALGWPAKKLKARTRYKAASVHLEKW